jgi:hypothetical protein
VVDEVQAWYLTRAEREGWVYTSVLRQLINRMYRERDYLAQRKRDGRRTAYDYAVDRDQVALAWAPVGRGEGHLSRRAQLERAAQTRLGRHRAARSTDAQGAHRPGREPPWWIAWVTHAAPPCGFLRQGDVGMVLVCS